MKGCLNILICESVGLGLEVEAKIEDNIIYAKVDDVAKGLGITTIAKSGNACVRWTRVNKYLSEFGLSTQVAKNDFIQEQYIYLLAMKANNEAAQKFQLWLATEVIPSLRQSGVIITDNAKDEDIDFVKLFGTAQRVKKTFMSCVDLFDTYDSFVNYSKRKLDIKTRVKRLNQIILALKDREDNLYKTKTKGYKVEK
ncbi:Bro-N domain-containing protein [Clostridium sp.]|uniref:BRO-N domain-containing protein n=1 Tax=Clostridium sp. TaxID=1506 RepID=UPI003993FDC0